MPRLNVINPEQAEGKAREILEGPLKQKQLNIFKGLANNPDVLDGYLKFSGGVKSGGSLTAAQHEMIALRVGQTNDCQYCLSVHSKLASGFKLSDDQIMNARRGKMDEPKNAALLRFVDAMVEKKGFVSDEELNAFRSAGYDDAAVVEVVGAIVVNYFTNLFNHVHDTEVDPVFPPAAPLT